MTNNIRPSIPGLPVTKGGPQQGHAGAPAPRSPNTTAPSSVDRLGQKVGQMTIGKRPVPEKPGNILELIGGLFERLKDIACLPKDILVKIRQGNIAELHQEIQDLYKAKIDKELNPVLSQDLLAIWHMISMYQAVGHFRVDMDGSHYVSSLNKLTDSESKLKDDLIAADWEDWPDFHRDLMKRSLDFRKTIDELSKNLPADHTLCEAVASSKEFISNYHDLFAHISALLAASEKQATAPMRDAVELDHFNNLPKRLRLAFYPFKEKILADFRVAVPEPVVPHDDFGTQFCQAMRKFITITILTFFVKWSIKEL
ncbi:hypothetical protein H696_04188 [Fonticula alba]|uniref:Uncharacterized protein n=1 Tax=Fonticula alba TaxID=691883 RepID=A0A058Z675_FONAL|nr:hypothetical protein H696_04188 [Fonticula alba]KCV69775.1 hypothetical protein H696_04188 [Fonticula alba]|eukprot:XP_009496340.1 hypothetical protein H696_04188 [Fonticula alba]